MDALGGHVGATGPCPFSVLLYGSGHPEADHADGSITRLPGLAPFAIVHMVQKELVGGCDQWDVALPTWIRWRNPVMYIGLGTIVLIIVVVLVVMALRRR